MNGPEVVLLNRQRKIACDLGWLEECIRHAAPMCDGKALAADLRLGRFDTLDFVIVSDRTIARIHKQFMNIPGATDVITFEHGEIVMSAETALTVSRELGHSVEKELLLYAIHGMLHLCGYDDLDPRSREEMHRVQTVLLSRVSVHNQE